MKSKSKNSHLRKLKDFRFHNTRLVTKKGNIKKIRHPAYVFLKKGNIYIYVTLTHSDSIPNVLLIKLRKNPNPKDSRDSYRVVDIKEDVKDSFGKRLINWEMSPLDDQDIREEYKKR